MPKELYEAINTVGVNLKSIYNSAAEAPELRTEKNGEVNENAAGVKPHKAFAGPYADGVPDNNKEGVQPTADQTQDFVDKNPQLTYSKQLTPAPQPGAQPVFSSVPTPKPGR